MKYICLFIVLLFAVLLLCVYLYRRNRISPEQKLLNDFAKMNRILEKRIKKDKKNMEKNDEYTEQIWQIIKDNNEKLNRMRNDSKTKV